MREWYHWLDQLESTIGKDSVLFWLRSIKIDHFDARNIYLNIQDSFQQQWIQEHLLPLAKDQFQDGSGRPIQIHFSKNIKAKPINKKPVQKELAPPSFKSPHLNPYLTRKNFLQFSSNQLPCLALDEITTSKTFYNPIYIHSGHSSGKTHLLMGTCKQALSQGLAALYTNAETFTHHVIQAMRRGYMHEFRQMYRNIDLLLIDDVQLFEKKHATQEELFHTFNTLYTANIPIVLSGNSPPSHLKDIQDRLISRFEWGLVLELASPSEDEKEAIFKARIKELKLELTSDAEAFLLKNLGQNIKHLSEALETLHQSSPKSPLNAHALKHLLDRFIQTKEEKKLSPDSMIDLISEHYNISRYDILGKSQKREFTQARHLTLFLCRTQLKMPFTKIAKLFSRDHSTVMSAIKGVEQKIKDPSHPLAISLQEVLQTLKKE